MNPSDVIRPHLAQMPKTVHGGQGWRLNGVEDYSHNLNPFGPPEDIGDIIARASEGIDHYPDDSCAELKDTISKQFKIRAESIMIGSGSSEIIRNFPNTFLSPGERALISRPSFAEYSHQCRIAGADVVWNELHEKDSFRIDYEQLKKNAEGCKAVYICNPNNPTGRLEKRENILSFVEWCEEKGILVFLDETLLELVPGYDSITCSGYVGRYTNLIVAGSLTKSFAIPGIRIGFGFSSEAIVKEMNKVRMTWNIGQIEQATANLLIKERMDHVHGASAVMKTESEWMYSRLKEIGFPVTMTDSFFFFDSVSSLGMDASGFTERMKRNGILVRDCSSFGTGFESYVRFCVKDRERNSRFIDAVKDSMR